MRDKRMYQSIFAHGIIAEFHRRYKIQNLSVVIILLYDIYPRLTIEDAMLWGVTKDVKYLYRKRQDLCKQGLLIHVNISDYQLTIKGKQLIKEFKEYYDNKLKIALEKGGKR
jgi:hypothetical protein